MYMSKKALITNLCPRDMKYFRKEGRQKSNRAFIAPYKLCTL